MNNSPHMRGWSAVDEEITLGKPDHKETLDMGMEEKAELNPKEKWMKMRGPN
jgi:isopenicillin N synthase-like dioxygenase